MKETNWRIRLAADEDRLSWVRLRCLLWPDEPQEVESESHSMRLDDDDQPVFLAVDAANRAIGFLEASTRSIAEGADSGPVGYVEGWFVEEDWRGRGVGRALIQACEEWSRRRGYSYLASDAEIDNTASQDAHRSLGFEEVERIVCFLKRLNDA